MKTSPAVYIQYHVCSLLAFRRVISEGSASPMPRANESKLGETTGVPACCESTSAHMSETSKQGLHLPPPASPGTAVLLIWEAQRYGRKITGLKIRHTTNNVLVPMTWARYICVFASLLYNSSFKMNETNNIHKMY